MIVARPGVVRVELAAAPGLAGILNALVAPRPIAWVTTIDDRGVVNLAPFSYYNLLSENPPVVAFSPARKPDGAKKDTLRNLEITPEFVINLVAESTADACNLSSKSLEYGASELELAGLTAVPSAAVRPPRVGESPAHLECRVRQLIPLGDHAGAYTIVLGDVVHIHVADVCLTGGKPDGAKLRCVGRMGGSDWCRTRDTMTMPRPG